MRYSIDVSDEKNDSYVVRKDDTKSFYKNDYPADFCKGLIDENEYKQMIKRLNASFITSVSIRIEQEKLKQPRWIIILLVITTLLSIGVIFIGLFMPPSKYMILSLLILIGVISISFFIITFGNYYYVPKPWVNSEDLFNQCLQQQIILINREYAGKFYLEANDYEDFIKIMLFQNVIIKRRETLFALQEYAENTQKCNKDLKINEDNQDKQLNRTKEEDQTGGTIKEMSSLSQQKNNEVVFSDNIEENIIKEDINKETVILKEQPEIQPIKKKKKGKGNKQKKKSKSPSKKKTD